MKKSQTSNIDLKDFHSMYHRMNDQPCLAWYVNKQSYQLWKTGSEPLRAHHVLLPSLEQPVTGHPIVCGTCGMKNIGPKDLFIE